MRRRCAGPSIGAAERVTGRARVGRLASGGRGRGSDDTRDAPRATFVACASLALFTRSRRSSGDRPRHHAPPPRLRRRSRRLARSVCPAAAGPTHADTCVACTRAPPRASWGRHRARSRWPFGVRGDQVTSARGNVFRPRRPTVGSRSAGLGRAYGPGAASRPARGEDQRCRPRARRRAKQYPRVLPGGAELRSRCRGPRDVHRPPRGGRRGRACLPGCDRPDRAEHRDAVHRRRAGEAAFLPPGTARFRSCWSGARDHLGGVYVREFRRSAQISRLAARAREWGRNVGDVAPPAFVFRARSVGDRRGGGAGCVCVEYHAPCLDEITPCKPPPPRWSP